MLLFGLIVFLAAFLLFQVQPMIAKMILPWFGGASNVWSACMLFFQAALLAGYLYAHWLQKRLSPKRQAAVHTALLALSLAALPIIPSAAWKAGTGAPVWRILGLLAVTVGLPYFTLASASPLLQVWFARARPGVTPYRLYALANFASMLGLLTYPVLIEPNLSTSHQAKIWSAAYACFAVLCAARAWMSANAPEPEQVAADLDPGPPPAWSAKLLWLALPACASILLLAMTNYLTQDVAPVPFLWILPLAVYLLSFIICFEAPRLYIRGLYLPLLVPALGVMAYALYKEGDAFTAAQSIAVTTGALFICSMVCHGEAARAKPHPRHLTLFYIMLALGGAVGGVFVGLVAPVVFTGCYEFPIGLVLCAALAAVVLLTSYRAFFSKPLGKAAAAVLLVAVSGFAGFLTYTMHESVTGYRVVTRNFYGQLRVLDVDEDDGIGRRRKLYHGLINHGEQLLAENQRRRATTYYCPATAAGRVLTQGKEGPPRRIALIGLGCGTLASYGRQGDTIRIYEINPKVIELARTEFSFLRDSQADVQVVLGDARLSLEREAPENFDVILMDAFSGDSVPVHLLTREAFALYFRHLKPGGMLAMHISNRYLDLDPVMERAASSFGRLAADYSFEPEEGDDVCFDASWVLIAESSMKAALPGGSPEILKPHPNFRTWTDDFSSFYRILK
jgi:hypothetical protein